MVSVCSVVMVSVGSVSTIITQYRVTLDNGRSFEVVFFEIDSFLRILKRDCMLILYWETTREGVLVSSTSSTDHCSLC